MKIIELIDVTKRFAGFTAVAELSFHVEKGAILSLLGPSGCGKTTTLRLISGFEALDEGRIVISGQDMHGRRPYERNVGLLFQDYALFPHMTVKQNIAYGLKHRGHDKRQIPKRTAEMLELVKLSGLEDRRPRQLSGGQQQRVALARALATNPEVVLLDEPLSALDAKLRQELRIELKEILRAVGATTIVVTHDQEEAMSLGDTVIVMSQGRIMQQGPPTEIYANPRTRFVAEFIGRSNWFSGRFSAGPSDRLRHFVASGDEAFMVPAANGTSRADAALEVCIRPERIHTGHVPGDWGEGPVNTLSGVIRHMAHLGSDIHLLVELPSGKRLTVIEQYLGQTLEQEGEPVTLTFRPQDCIVVPADS